MTEYIKREDAIQSVMNHDILKSEWSRDWAEYMLEDAPSADVAPIVRCKDCKKDGTRNCPFKIAKFGYTDIDFCSCGERKDDETI